MGFVATCNKHNKEKRRELMGLRWISSPTYRTLFARSPAFLLQRPRAAVTDCLEDRPWVSRDCIPAVQT